MGHQKVTQAVIQTDRQAIDAAQGVEAIAFFRPDGTQVIPGMASLVTTGTAAGTAAKTTTAAEPVAGALVPIKFTNGNTAASPTVAFNGGTARNILLGGTAPGAAEITIGANGIAFFYFDGTNLHQFGVVS